MSAAGQLLARLLEITAACREALRRDELERASELLDSRMPLLAEFDRVADRRDATLRDEVARLRDAEAELAAELAQARQILLANSQKLQRDGALPYRESLREPVALDRRV